ncbi:NAD(P)-binding protein [Pseudohyphozyma bogoriensis]|nr:NAD(P)-binding protein [Pseudohyphozyma bogoriensis]
MAATTWTFLREQLFGKMVDTTTRLDGNTVIITGSNAGLGFAAAIQIAKLNPDRLILAVRDNGRGTAAAERIRAATGYKGRLEVWELDLSSFDSVKRFAAQCETLERLDVIIQNAGIPVNTWGLTPDGWERRYENHVAINDISTGLLAVLLLPVLSRTAKRFPSTLKPTMTIVGSEVHIWAAFKEKAAPGSILATLNDEKKFAANDRYFLTKLLDLFIARKLATLPLASDVRISVVNPGMCASELLREMPWLQRVIMGWFSRTSAQGARNLVWAAVECAESPAYVSVCRVSQPSAWSTSLEGLAVQHRVWEELSTEWVKIAPEVARLL